MYLYRPVSYFLLLTLLVFPVLMLGHENRITIHAFVPEVSVSAVHKESVQLYAALNLHQRGLSRSAFDYAWQGYLRLHQAGRIRKGSVLTICDYSQSSRNKRLYVLDIKNQKIVCQTYVAHGRNSGGEFAHTFSNKPESYKSSLGFFITRQTYHGTHGLALNLEGLERGINDRAGNRKIVVHGSPYVGRSYLRAKTYTGRSLGCPAVPAREARKIISAIEGGTCLFIYHPTRNYFIHSSVLN
ncbi:MAG: murein L,D-transpeptidase catalytic domain family protein [Chitinophagaceae bacterium]